MKAFSYIFLGLLCGLTFASPKTPKERSLNKANKIRSLLNQNFRSRRKERKIFFIKILNLELTKICLVLLKISF